MRIVTLGEIMLRLTPVGYRRFVQAETFEAVYGGAEANVAVALSNWGAETAFVSKVPANDMGQAAVNVLRKYGVETRHILRGGERLGIYFSERGADRRASKVIYDRAGSAFALSAPEEYDWDAILSGADWVHFTGITPALGPNAAAVAECACKKAKARNICISCDVNYRSKLWGVEQARAAMEKLLPYTDVCIINENQAKELFGVEGEKGAREMAEKFSLSHVAFTYRRTWPDLFGRPRL